LIPPQDEYDPEIVDHARTRIVLILLLINFSVLLFSGLAGYILAGQTLRPIQEMMDEQSRFVTDSSHELRTPLTALRSEIEVNLRDPKLSLATAKELLRSNLEEVKNLQQLSDSLIRLTQYQSGQNGLQFVQVSLPVIIDEAVKKVRAIAKAKQIKIKQEIPEVLVHANSAMLSELFVILLDNAIKYSPEKTTITVNASVSDHHVRVSVTDQGLGIAADDLPHIFDRFYRADKSRTQSDIQGYGLGLSIAKEVVEKHRGQITVSSVVESGTTFTVQLPVRHG
jgi:signal transduction histidine kinase